MTKIRVLVFLLSTLVIGVAGVIFIMYAKGYRLDGQTFTFAPNGILVANSQPTGAQIFINGELKGATNSTLPLHPGTYDIAIKKDQYITWNKRMVIEKEVVTQIDTFLFPAAPSLSAITFAGVFNPVISPDLTKIAYGDKAGIWVIETFNFPIGFNREPRKIVDTDVTNATWQWSPDSRELILKSGLSSYLLNATTFTDQGKLVNIAGAQETKTLALWNQEKQTRLISQLSQLPSEIGTILQNKTTNIAFSPDEQKILYQATSNGSIPSGIIPGLPGSSTQKQERALKAKKFYVFDRKEDRNFEVGDETQVLYWFPTSNHLVLPEKDKVTIMDYDGTNRQSIYTGNYVFPNAYPSANVNRIFILTNLGADKITPNLYSLSLK